MNKNDKKLIVLFLLIIAFVVGYFLISKYLNTNVVPESNEAVVTTSPKREAFISSDYYVRIDNAVYFRFLNDPLIKVDGADLDSFYILNEFTDFAFDKDHVYIDGAIVHDADPKTFESIGYQTHYKDKNFVYYKERIDPIKIHDRLVKIPEMNPALTRKVTDYIIADDSSVYRKGKKMDILDPKTFTVVKEPYFTDSKATYFLRDYKDSPFTVMALAPLVKIFTHEGYAQIGNQIFFATTTVINADPGTFKVFDGQTSSGDLMGECTGYNEYCPYASDIRNVYFKGLKIEGADPETFSMINDSRIASYEQPAQSRYAKDINHVYYLGQKLNEVNVRTFSPIMSGRYFFEYGKDNRSVFWHSYLIDGANPITFSIFEGQQPYEGCGVGPYSKDDKYVFYQNKIINGADVKSFKIVDGNGYYGQDDKNMYYGTEIIDPKDFKVCEYG